MDRALKRRSELRRQLCAGGLSRRRQGANDDIPRRVELTDAVIHRDGTQLARHRMSRHGIAHLLGHNKPKTRTTPGNKIVALTRVDH